MENWEEEFTDQWFASTEGKNDIRRNRIKELTLKIREDTLRQVLPEKVIEDFYKNYEFYGGYTSAGVHLLIKNILDKAKEIWGIDFNKD